MEKEQILSDKIFFKLVEAASMASSADNMQPWKFRKQDNTIEVYLASKRKLPTDVNNMFSWIGIGAAIQNIVVSATSYNLEAKVEYTGEKIAENPVAIVCFTFGKNRSSLVNSISLRQTNRNPFDFAPLRQELVEQLTESIKELKASVFWTTKKQDFDSMVKMDASSSYIRLAHKPLYEELFQVLRFSQKELENLGYGLSFESLGVPKSAVFMAKLLRFWAINKLISRLGFGKLIAKDLATKLAKTGAICLITALERSPAGYMEAGRAMEQLWLEATQKQLSVQPYGVLPQYLTKTEIEPETFTGKYLSAIQKHRKPFYSVFPGAEKEYPAIVLRIGKTNKKSLRTNLRLSPGDIILD